MDERAGCRSARVEQTRAVITVARRFRLLLPFALHCRDTQEHSE